MPRDTSTFVSAVLVGCLVLASCSAAPQVTPSMSVAAAPSSAYVSATTAGTALPVPDHVVVVVLENKDVDQVAGSDDAPYLNSLAAASATFPDAHAETHPSQPNYIALFSGSTQGVRDDGCLDAPFSAPSLGGRLLAAGRTFTGYSEGLPAVGYTGCEHDGYARKHNPWVGFADVPESANRPLSDLPADYTQLPTLAFVIPDLCHDMHDCDVATGDAWMRQHIDPYATWARAHNSLLVVTFDESDSHEGANGIVTLFSGSMVRPGAYQERIDHYRILRTFVDMYGLEPLGRSAESTPITDVWNATS
jgi:phosphatidylinositol-3-phosphatase